MGVGSPMTRDDRRRLEVTGATPDASLISLATVPGGTGEPKIIMEHVDKWFGSVPGAEGRRR